MHKLEEECTADQLKKPIVMEEVIEDDHQEDD